MQEHLIRQEITAFLIDRQARGLSSNTIYFYRIHLADVETYLQINNVETVENVTPTVIREFLIDAGRRRNPNGVDAYWRAISAWLHWWEKEVEPESWKNPILKVERPKRPTDPLPGVEIDAVKMMASTCHKNFIGQRDRAILLFLLDTGLRCEEFLSLNYGDVDMATGEVRLRKGKGGKGRSVFIASKAKRELIRYLRYRGRPFPAEPLWISKQQNRLSKGGLRQVMRRHSALAGIDQPTIHDFRRAFTIESLRNGMDILSISRLLGHSDIDMVRRYARQVKEDLHRAHESFGPVDNSSI